MWVGLLLDRADEASQVCLAVLLQGPPNREQGGFPLPVGIHSRQISMWVHTLSPLTEVRVLAPSRPLVMAEKGQRGPIPSSLVVDGGGPDQYSGAKWREREQSRVPWPRQRCFTAEGSPVGLGGRFFGSYEHSLDAKGRLILPARLRGAFALGGFLSPHLEGCLGLWPSESFEKEIDLRLAQAAGDAIARNEVREWAAAVFEAELDAQGRMVIPAHLRSYAGLQQEVLVVGMIDRVELWSPSAWASKARSPSAGAPVNDSNER